MRRAEGQSRCFAPLYTASWNAVHCIMEDFKEIIIVQVVLNFHSNFFSELYSNEFFQGFKFIKMY